MSNWWEEGAERVSGGSAVKQEDRWWADGAQPVMSAEERGSIISEAMRWTDKQKDDFMQFRKRIAIERKELGESDQWLGVSALKSTAYGLGSMVARGTMQDSAADALNRRANAVAQVRNELLESRHSPDSILSKDTFRRLGNIGSNMLETVPPMVASGGGSAAIGMAAAQTGNKAITEGRDVGMRGVKLGAYAGTQAGLEALFAGAFQKVGLGGAESLAGMKQQLAKTVPGFLKQLGVQVGAELTEEIITELNQNLTDALYQKDMSKVSPEAQRETIIQTTLQTLGTMGLLESGSVKANVDSIKGHKYRGEIIKAADEGRTPSRAEWKRWGLNEEMGRSAKDRAENVKDTAIGLREIDAIERGEQRPSEQQEVAETAATEQSAQPQQDQQSPREATSWEQVTEGGLESQSVIADKSVNERQATPEVEQRATPQPTAITPDQDITSTKIAVRDHIIRALRGESPIETAVTKPVEQSINEAESAMREDPTYLDGLLKEVAVSPRPFSDVEHAAMQIGYRQVNNTINELTASLNKSTSPLDRARIQLEIDSALDRARVMEVSAKSVGTQWGRAGAVQKIELLQDFTPAALIRKGTRAKGSKLDSAEVDSVTTLSRKIAEQESTVEKESQKAEQQAAESAIDEEIKATSKSANRKKRGIARKTQAEKAARDAWKGFKAKLAEKSKGRSASGFLKGESGALDIELVESAVDVVRAYAALGKVTLSEITAAARTTLGDAGVEMFTEAWNQLRAAGEIAVVEFDPNDQRAVAREVKRLQKSLIEEGVTSRDTLVDAIHAEMKAYLPDITSREIMDAMSGYGKYRQPTVDTVKQTINDINAQLRQLSKIEDTLSGKPAKKGVKRPDKSEALKQLERMSRQLGREVAASQDGQQQDAARKMTPEERQAKAYRKLLEQRKADYQDRLDRGDFSKPQKKEKVYPESVMKAKYELEQLKSRFREMEDAWIRKNATGLNKALHVTAEVLNTSRAIMTSFDLSALGRQGSFAAAGHPIMAIKASADMFKAFASKRGEFDLIEGLNQRKNATLYRLARLSLTQSMGRLSKMEEAFLGQWSKYLPGISASNRAYVAFLNRMRADMFDSMVASLGRNGEVTLDQAKVIANYVNIATGRGSLDFGRMNLEGASVGLATVFFSPRYQSSRVQLLVGQPFRHGTREARTGAMKRLIATEYARSAIGLGTYIGSLILAAGMYNDDDDDRPAIELDPRSGVFMRPRFGNRYFDPAAGLAAYTTLASRVLVPESLGGGKTKTIKGKMIPMSADTRPYGGTGKFDALARFVRQKFSPGISGAIDLAEGENVVGDKTDAARIAIGMTNPLAVRDSYEIVKNEIGRGEADSLFWAVFLSSISIGGTGSVDIPQKKVKGKSSDDLIEDELELFNGIGKRLGVFD